MTLPINNPYEPPQEENRREERPTSRFACTVKYAVWGLFIGGIGFAINGLANIGNAHNMQHFFGIFLPVLVQEGAMLGLFFGLVTGWIVDSLRWESRPPRR